MNRKPVIIKRYGNRRLYDTTNSRYINQDEVAQMVRDGQEVQVVDAATGEDLTRLVLTQIIVQHAKEPDSAFPLDILRQMVAACGEVTEGTTLKYMKAVADMYQTAYRAMTPPVNPFEFMRPSVVPPGGSPASWGSAEENVYGNSTAAQKNKEEPSGIDDLKQRVEELTSLVSRLSSKKSGRKRKSKSKKK